MSSSFRRIGRPKQSAVVSSNQQQLQQVAEGPHPPISSASTTTTTTTTGPFSSSTPVLERVGTKPWIGGLTLTSTGLREFDAIVGGGQPLGTAILLEEDRWTQDLALCLVRYWSAEALSQGQTLALVSTLQGVEKGDVESYDSFNAIPNLQQGMSRRALEAFLQMLPRDQHLDKAREKTNAMEKKIESEAASGEISSLLGINAIPEVEDDFEDEVAVGDDDVEHDMGSSNAAAAATAAEEGLSNAWQYKLSVQRERMGVVPLSTPKQQSSGSGGDRIFCHSYNLAGKMVDQHDAHWENNPHIEFVNGTCTQCPPWSCTESKACAMALYHSCISHIHKKITEHPKTVVRMLLLNAPVQKVAMALPMLLRYIRHHSLPVVLFVTVRPWQHRPPSYHHHYHPASYTQSLVSLRRTCDAVFACEGFSAMMVPPPPEFADLAGILSIRKIALQALSHFSDTTTSRRPPANRYGLKRDRRKLNIRMLHLPPEDFSAGGSSVGSGVRSGAGKLKERGTEQGMGNDSTIRSSGSTPALLPGLACASHMRPGSSSSTSLDF